MALFLILALFPVFSSMAAWPQADGGALPAGSSPSPGGALQEELLPGSLDDALKSLSLEKGTLELVVCGKPLHLPVVIQKKYNDIYMNLDDREVKALFAALAAGLETESQNRIITVQRTGVPKSEEIATVKEAEYTSGTTTVRLSPPPFVARGLTFLALKHVPLLTGGLLSRDKKKGLYYLDPTLTSITVTPGKKHYFLRMAGTASFRQAPFILKNPRRYVIDLVNIHLSEGLLQMPQKEIFHEAIGKITFSQNEVNPNRVRVVIPLAEGMEVRLNPPQGKNSAEVMLTPRSPSSVCSSFSLQTVSAIRMEVKGKESKVLVNVSGPVEYEWHRFKPPDNRFFVDLHKARLLGKKQTLKTDNPLIEEIRIAQFQDKPEPVVRIAIELKEHYLCKFAPPSPGTKQVALVISHELINLDDAVMDGNGVTSYPRPGKKIICIDPGHGGYDSGAVNASLGLCEKTVTLDIAKRLSALLAERGWNVVLTRSTDRDVSYYGSTDLEELSARVKVAKEMKADIFISIHCDASSNTAVRGISTHWYKEHDNPLAAALHQRMLEELQNRDRKIHKNRFYVLSHSSMPSALVETAFISNAGDASKLNSPDYRGRIAKALAGGIELYFRLHPKK
ncbi:MAG: N-acetylmuramoyl-L-alanine amidase [Candidatus Eremiobacteraeota bacterium]|nr:N-acetylmuramoyl-L-alanine amidase [Candidatus Eremiobacteraeota bacterium]